MHDDIKRGENCYIHAMATLIGKITLGDEVSIWPGAVLRADLNYIKIGSSTSIQDNAVVHLCEKFCVEIGCGVTVGHGAVLHGCRVGDNCLIGMHATILDGAQIGDNCIIGASALVTQNKIIPPNSLVLGSPGKILREITQDEMASIRESAKSYVKLIKMYA